jgi:ferritin-like metal-binding protein YciE
MAKRPDQDALRQLAVSELQSLLSSEPKLVRGFAHLVKQATSPRLRKFCREGVEYTERRVERLREALELLEAPVKPLASEAMPALIADAIAAGRSSNSDDEACDLAILTAIERISHYGLASYTSIDRFLRASRETKARRVLAPCIKEKREAIAEMGQMAREKFIPPLRKRLTSSPRSGRRD